MATITTGGSGNWSSTTANAPWPGGTLPLITDDVIIAKNHTVTLDITTAVCLTLTLNNGTTGADIGGIFTVATDRDTKLTLGNRIITARVASTQYMSSFLADLSASTNTCEIVVNYTTPTNSANGICYIGGNYTLKGAPKKRHSVTKAGITGGTSTSVDVDDVTGWLAGDILVFASTQSYNGTRHTDKVTIETITPTSGTSATVTWTDGAGAGGSVLYSHLTNCPVGNFTSNLKFSTNGQWGCGAIYLAGWGDCMSQDSVIDNTVIHQLRCPSLSGTAGILSVRGDTGSRPATRIKQITNVAFFDCRDRMIGIDYQSWEMIRNNQIFYSTVAMGDSGTFALSLADSRQVFTASSDEDYVLFSVPCGINGPASPYMVQRRHKISECGSTVGGPMTSGIAVMEDCQIWGCRTGETWGLSFSGPTQKMYRCSFDSKVFAGVSTTSGVAVKVSTKAQLIDCLVPDDFFTYNTSPNTMGSVQLVNRNGDPSLQDIFQYQSTTVSAVSRDNSIFTRSLSSLRMTLNSTKAQEYSFEVLARAGVTERVLLYVRKNSSYGASTLPKAVVSGLGITPVTVTMAGGTAADTWELLTIDFTNTTSTDGLLTVTLSAQSSTAGAIAYFSGLTCAPFITRCRHYGYLFDEAIPVRTANPAISASEATAAAYTGVTIDSVTPKITVATGTANTFQKVYDYIQAWACLNVDKTVLLTSTDGINFNVPLTCKVDWAGMGTDGILAGGWLLLDTPGTYDINLSGTKIDFTTAGTYTLSDSLLTGTVELVNSSGGAVIVMVASEVSYTNTGPDITVEAPVLTSSITVTGAVTGTLIQLWDTIADEELYIGTGPYTWSEEYADDRTIRLRAMYCDEDSATIFKEETIGNITEASPAITYLLSQQEDNVYAANAIDGSTVTGITIDDDNLLIEVDTASISYPEIYAYETYWLATEDGIRDETRIITATDTANYIFSGFKIKNIGTGPLLITGGYGRDADTGSVLDMMDTTGQSIFPAPDHVVPYAAGAEATVATVQAGLSAQGYTGSRAGKIDNLDAAVSSIEPDNDGIAFLAKITRNKRVITADKKIVVYDDDDTTPILEKQLADKDGSAIADLAAGVLAQEGKSSV